MFYIFEWACFHNAAAHLAATRSHKQLTSEPPVWKRTAVVRKSNRNESVGNLDFASANSSTYVQML